MYQKNKNQTHKERFLINLLPDGLFSAKPAERTAAINGITDNTGFHTKRNEAAEKEMQQPVNTLVETVKQECKNIAAIPKTMAEGTGSLIGTVAGTVLSKPVELTGKIASKSVGITGKVATALVTTPVGWAGNILRAGADAGRFILRIPAIVADFVAEGIGKISAIAQSTNTSANSMVDKATGKIDEVTEKLTEKLDIGKPKS